MAVRVEHLISDGDVLCFSRCRAGGQCDIRDSARPRAALQDRESVTPIIGPEIFIASKGNPGLELCHTSDRRKVMLAAESRVFRLVDDIQKPSFLRDNGPLIVERPHAPLRKHYERCVEHRLTVFRIAIATTGSKLELLPRVRVGEFHQN